MRSAQSPITAMVGEVTMIKWSVAVTETLTNTQTAVEKGKKGIKKGISGNPKGRPKGIYVRRTR